MLLVRDRGRLMSFKAMFLTGRPSVQWCLPQLALWAPAACGKLSAPFVCGLGGKGGGAGAGLAGLPLP